MRPGLSISQRMYYGFGAILLVLVALVGFAFFSFRRLADANERNLHTHRVLEAAQSLLTSVIGIQSGYRGFMLAGSPEFLEPLEEGIPAFDRHLAHLGRLTRDDPRQQRLLAEVAELQERWLDSHVYPRLAQRREIANDTVSLQELLSLADAGRGRRFVQAIGARIDSLTASEAQLQESRESAVARLKSITALLLILGGVFAGLIILVLATLTARSWKGLVTANQRLEREVQERMRAEEQVERVSHRNELILNAAGEGIYGLDRDGCTTFANPAALRMTGFSAEELLGRPNHALVHHSRTDGTAYPREECPIFSSLADGLVHAVSDEVFWRKDGTSFPVEYIATPIWEDGEITGAVVTFDDITERREVERMKDEFISVVSHELRTPLTSIRGSLGLLSSGRLGTLPDRGQRLLDIATQNTDRLVRLINDILDIERIESGRVEMERTWVDAAALLAQAAQVVHGFAQREGVQLEVEPFSARLWADADRVVQVLTNLLSNAVKFSSSGGRVWLRARAVEGRIRFEVQDEGRGIPADKLDSIFGRFQQVDASDSREKGGTGLGLAIARSIIQQHGGEIGVESEPGKGSTFFFTIPLGDAGERAGPSPARLGKGLVLLCDDDPEIRHVVGAQLEQQGFRVLTAESGASAIRLAEEHRPDAILLDLMMPEMDGWETMTRLKEREATRDVPILIFSAATPQPEAAEQAGAAGWVGKSSEEASLFRALNRTLTRSAPGGRILLVEDDRDLAEVLLAMFQRHGLSAAHAETCQEAIDLSREHPFDLVVLDVILREETGFDVVDCMRRHDRLRLVPLVIYSAMDLNDEERDRLRLGRTEFFTKGRISPEEFEGRVLSLLAELLTTASGRTDDPQDPDR